MATRSEIGDVLQVLHALYPHSSPIPKGLSQAKMAEAVASLAQPWHTILGDLPTGLLNAAVRQLASSGREFFPPAGVVRQAALDPMPQRAAATKTAGETCARLRNTYRRRRDSMI